ncbi:MAG TPA: hypothetical protein VES88_13260 [Gemmatimonadaceae bacterium]|nr:hypothetical protein [Gemmatimonadaceae bacterium]
MADASAASGLSAWSAGESGATRPSYRSRTIVQHAGIAAQLAVLLGLLYALEIEPDSGLPRILPLVFAGFIAHASLPPRHRLQLFLLLSLAALALVLGVAQGATVAAIAFVLVAICHLPLPFGVRVGLLALTGTGLAALRAVADPLQIPLRVPGAMLAVVGSMFMFRIIIYMYDLRHEELARRAGRNIPGGHASVWIRLSYFFLLPNVCFLLFPVVDYRTYRRTYYDSEATVIYQKGVWWIALGLAYLVAYRLVYHYLVIAPEQVESLGGVVRFMVSSYLVYLRVVGQFHLVIGFLCLFGFNLPPAHRFFLLATGFTDFWRRTRIDWKDFMVKVFYFPASVPLQRRWGTTAAVVVATLGVFIVTWLLHSYQWFWLRGDFPLSTNDAVFWGIFGACVLVNSLLETRSRRKRAGDAATLAGAAARAVNILGMFAFLSVLWSYWSSTSLSDWLWTLSSLRRAPLLSYAKLIAAIAVAFVTLVLAHITAARISDGSAPRADGGRPDGGRPGARRSIVPGLRPAGVGLLGAALLLVVLPAKTGVFGASTQRLAATVGTNRLNTADRFREDRGYYETLLDTRRPIADPTADPAREAIEAGAFLPIYRMRFVRRREDLITYELVPAYRGGLFRGKLFETNQWGMRDKEYALTPPPNAYRIALLGASYEMGASVNVEENFESILEERLNRDGPGAPLRRYEILNFAVGGYSVLQNAVVAEQKAFNFAPNALVVGLKELDFGRGLDILVGAVRRGAPIPYPEIREKLREAGVTREMSDLELRGRIKPLVPDILQWSLQHIGRLARARGVRAIALVLPRPDPEPGDAQIERDLATWASQAGFSVIRLDGVFSGQPLDSIRIPPPDGHPNARGHRMIADRLYHALRDNDASLLGLGFQARDR